jgi:AcrR family transcriptional regulator
MATRAATVETFSDTTRHGRRRLRTRAQLLRAAKHCFATKGFHGTKIADIAAAADVGTGTFYLYFPTKDALFADLVKETTLRAKEEMDRAKAPYPDPRDKARVGAETFFRFADANRDVFKILFGHSAHFDALLREVHQIFIRDIEENYTLGVEAGVFRPIRPALVAQAIVGMLSQLVSWWIDREDVSTEEIMHATHRLLMDGTVLKEEQR